MSESLMGQGREARFEAGAGGRLPRPPPQGIAVQLARIWRLSPAFGSSKFAHRAITEGEAEHGAMWAPLLIGSPSFLAPARMPAQRAGVIWVSRPLVGAGLLESSSRF